MHENAHLVGLDNQCDKLLNTTNSQNFISQFHLLEPALAAKEDQMDNAEYNANKYLHQLPEDFIIADLAKLKPIHRDNSLNFILHLDVQRYNSLLAIVKSELGALKRAILGLQV